MSIAQDVLGVFEHEAKTTRKFLERIPQDKLTWKPHEKSHTVGELAAHIASLPAGIARMVLQDSAPIPSEAEVFKQPATVAQVLASHDESTAAVRQILPTLTDTQLQANWSAMIDGKPVMTLPKAMVLHLIMMNHWIHHRGQLGVYLRLIGAKVPSSYGPSGDEW